MAEQPARTPSIWFFGISSLIISCFMIFEELFNLFAGNALAAMGVDFSLLAKTAPQSMQTLLELYSYSRIWSGFNIVYFGFIIFASVQFLLLRRWGRRALEIACWVGLFDGLVDVIVSYSIVNSMQSAIASTMRGMGGGAYAMTMPLGSGTIVVGLFLWAIPCCGSIMFLRRKSVRELVNQG